MLHYQKNASHAAAFSAKSFFCAIMLVLVSGGGVIRAQNAKDASKIETASASEKINTNLFKFFSYEHGGRLVPQDIECICGTQATLTKIPPCTPDTMLLAPPSADSCCCYELAVWTSCPYPACGFTVSFDDNTFDPTCGICSMPPHWTHTIDDNGNHHFDYNGPAGNEINNMSQQKFRMCGKNHSSTIGFTVCTFYCDGDPATGYHKRQPPNDLICCKHFTAPANCGSMSVQDNSDAKHLITVSVPFPNPSSKEVKFDYMSQTAGTLIIELTTILGSEVRKTLHFLSADEKESMVIDTRNLPSGSYLCSFEINGHRITRRLQVAH